jgi:hypothetical protein
MLDDDDDDDDDDGDDAHVVNAHVHVCTHEWRGRRVDGDRRVF